MKIEERCEMLQRRRRAALPRQRRHPILQVAFCNFIPHFLFSPCPPCSPWWFPLFAFRSRQTMNLPTSGDDRRGFLTKTAAVLCGGAACGADRLGSGRFLPAVAAEGHAGQFVG